MHVSCAFLSLSFAVALAGLQVESKRGQHLVGRSVAAGNLQRRLVNNSDASSQPETIALGRLHSFSEESKKPQGGQEASGSLRQLRRRTWEDVSESTIGAFSHEPSRKALEEQILAGSNKVVRHVSEASRHRTNARRSTSNSERVRHRVLEQEHVRAAQETRGNNIKLVRELKRWQKKERPGVGRRILERRGGSGSDAPAPSALDAKEQKDPEPGISQSGPPERRPESRDAVPGKIFAESDATHHQYEAARHQSYADDHAKQRVEGRPSEDSARQQAVAQQQAQRERIAPQHRQHAEQADDRMERQYKELDELNESQAPSRRLQRRGKESGESAASPSSERGESSRSGGSPPEPPHRGASQPGSPHHGVSQPEPPHHGSENPASLFLAAEREKEHHDKVFDMLRQHAQTYAGDMRLHRQGGHRDMEQQAARLHKLFGQLMRAHKQGAEEAEARMERHASALERAAHEPEGTSEAKKEPEAGKEARPEVTRGKMLGTIAEEGEGEARMSAEKSEEGTHERPRPHPRSFGRR